MSRFKWFITGGCAAAMALAAATYYAHDDRRRAEALVRENERLAESQRQLQRHAEELERQTKRLEEERRQLAAVIERLKLERRVARIDVLEQHTDPFGNVLQTVIRFTEVDPAGDALSTHTFGVPGRTPHFDALIIKFADEFVAGGDQLRGQSLALFRRVYGETQTPENGYWLGQPGSVPDAYRVGKVPSEFEANLWRQFWSYATDPEKARTVGVRVAQGEAVYAPMTTGETWTLTLEADGGLNLIKQPNRKQADKSVPGDAPAESATTG